VVREGGGDEEDDDEEEEEVAAEDAPVPSAPQPAPSSNFSANAPVFAARQCACPRPPGYKATMTIEDDVGKVFEISKTRACAIISSHPRCSKDRLVRVRAQPK
jgi:hypothetical protein